MDGSTDKAKVENEVIVLLYCSKDDEAEEMNTCARYFTVLEPAKADGDGLVQCLGKALQSMGIEDLVDRARHEREALAGDALVILGLVLRTSTRACV